MRKLSDPDYPRDAENSLLLYADQPSLDNDEEAGAIATSEEESGTSRRKTRELYWVGTHYHSLLLLNIYVLNYRMVLIPNKKLALYSFLRIDKRTLPWRLLPNGALEACARAQNRPLWVCDRISKELAAVKDALPYFTNRERLALIQLAQKMSDCIGACERIHQTVVPLNYARHSLRTLTIWLLSLPFALVGQLGLLTGPTLFIMSW